LVSCSADTLAVVKPVAPPQTTPHSSTTTRAPSRLRASAALMPAMPPPITATSKSMSSSSAGYAVGDAAASHSEVPPADGVRGPSKSAVRSAGGTAERYPGGCVGKRLCGVWKAGERVRVKERRAG
jgi:hypothetical protein